MRFVELNIMSILEAFNQYFEIIPASTEELRQEVYKLRYQVYCLEKGFLNPSPDGTEHDEYDEYSSHYLIRHHETGYMATTRLILPDRNHPEKLFPMEAYNQIDNAELLKSMPRNNIAELSRFCVSKEFRRRANERDIIVTNEVDDDRSPIKKHHSPNLTLALFACAVRISFEHDIHYWYAIMEPASKKIAAALGVNFVAVGSPMPSEHYYGLRAPYTIKVNDLLRGAEEKDPEYLEMLTGKKNYPNNH
jgi:N-acyl amino acid synthase of PEP-CTERM/exosortase system